jgi:hypothetical protein
MIRYFKPACDFRVGWLESGMLRKGPTLEKTARMGHPTAKAKTNFKGKKAQLQRHKASGGLAVRSGPSSAWWT